MSNTGLSLPTCESRGAPGIARRVDCYIADTALTTVLGYFWRAYLRSWANPDTVMARWLMTKCALICGAGGFIGGHLVKRLKNDGFWVRGVDLNQSRQFRGRRSAGPGVLSRHCRSPLR